MLARLDDDRVLLVEELSQGNPDLNFSNAPSLDELYRMPSAIRVNVLDRHDRRPQ